MLRETTGAPAIGSISPKSRRSSATVFALALLLGILMPASHCKRKPAALVDGRPAGKPAIVTAPSGLRLRRSPSLSGERVGLIPFGETVHVLEEQADEVNINGREGRWTKVQHGSLVGWAFGAWLKPAAEAQSVAPPAAAPATTAPPAAGPSTAKPPAATAPATPPAPATNPATPPTGTR